MQARWKWCPHCVHIFGLSASKHEHTGHIVRSACAAATITLTRLLQMLSLAVLDNNGPLQYLPRLESGKSIAKNFYM